MSSKRYDICTPRKGRDDKTFWTRIGTAWENDKGIQLVFDALPLPDAEGRCVANLFEPRQDNRSGACDRVDAQARGGQQTSYSHNDDLDDVVPF
jgi:hypothetical protein